MSNLRAGGWCTGWARAILLEYYPPLGSLLGCLSRGGWGAPRGVPGAPGGLPGGLPETLQFQGG
eukprot:1159929-Pelagomonas_calceolata.AAC.4